MYMLKRANAQSLPRPAFAPDFAFHLGMEFFYMFGTWMGWESLYKKYTRK
jgi:hypothetical protein